MNQIKKFLTKGLFYKIAMPLYQGGFEGSVGDEQLDKDIKKELSEIGLNLSKPIDPFQKIVLWEDGFLIFSLKKIRIFMTKYIKS